MLLLVNEGLQRADLEPYGLAEHLFERLGVTARRPELEFRIPDGT